MSSRSNGPLSLADLVGLISSGSLQDDDPLSASTSEGRAACEFFENNWGQARDGLLSRTDRIRVWPASEAGPPTAFRFEIDRPYKRKQADGMVVLEPGPISGTIAYRRDVMTSTPDSRPVCVFLRSRGFYHPNFSRPLCVLCVGPFPPGPYPLDALLLHIYAIVSYQYLGTNDPLDQEAFRYFTRDPEAFEGLGDVPPLY